MKIIQAIAYKIPIVPFEWVAKMHSLQNIADYAIDNDYPKFMKQDIADCSTLFKGFIFKFGSFSTSSLKDQLQSIIRVCKGTLYNSSVKRLNNEPFFKILTLVETQKRNENQLYKSFPSLGSQSEISFCFEREENSEQEKPQELEIDHHWIVDCVYLQKLLSLDKYTISVKS